MLRGSPLPHDELAGDPRHGYRTIIDALRGAADRSARRGIYVIDDRGHQKFRTYPQVLEAALRIGAALEGRGIGRRDRILFVLPTSFEFVSAFFGATAIGAIPVPIAPPPPEMIVDVSDRAEAVLRLSERLQTPAVLFGSSEQEGARPPQVRELRHVMDVGEIVEGVAAGATPARAAESSVAYIQPTSGAAGRRRAVELTHRNLLTNIDGAGRKIGVTPEDIAVSWLPLHSILGLVGVVLFCVYWEIDVVLMHPDRFLRRPDEWLHLFGRHGGTLAVAPSFGYDYCVRRCQESNLEGLDLSSWRVALNGGEPIRPEQMARFRERFGRHGFGDDVFTPVYGLTEGTLGVTFADVGSARVDVISREIFEQELRAEPLGEETNIDEALRFVSVGTPVHGSDVMVIDHRGIEVADRIIGEIAVRGPNVMRGYFDQPKKRSAGGTRVSGEWLMTGDFGYVADGELYVVGREAAMLETADGRLFVPHLVEDVIERVDGVRAGGAALFRTDDGTGVIVAVEIQEGAEPEEIEALIRSGLQRQFRLEPTEVRSLSPQSVPRSPTGKVRRHLVQKFYEENILDRKERGQEFDGMRRLLQRSRHQALKLGQSVAEGVRRLVTRDDRE